MHVVCVAKKKQLDLHQRGNHRIQSRNNFPLKLPLIWAKFWKCLPWPLFGFLLKFFKRCLNLFGRGSLSTVVVVGAGLCD